MALGLDLVGNKAAIVPYVRKGSFTIFVKETDAAGSPLTTGDGTVWQALGYTKDTKLGPSSSQYKEKDDTNADVVNITTIESYKVEFTTLQRNAATRRLSQNAAGKFYQAVLVGANIGTL